MLPRGTGIRGSDALDASTPETEGGTIIRRQRLLLAILPPLVLGSMFATPALAIPPTTEVVTIEDFTSVDTEICDFPITFIEGGRFKITTFYDDEANPVKTILTNSNLRYMSSATANGKTLSTNYPLVIITLLEDGTRIELGLRNAYHVPGEGVVLLDAGRVILDPVTGDAVFEAGQHQFLNGSSEAFCSYFAAP